MSSLAKNNMPVWRAFLSSFLTNNTRLQPDEDVAHTEKLRHVKHYVKVTERSSGQEFQILMAIHVCLSLMKLFVLKKHLT
jgi:hypothetical protein